MDRKIDALADELLPRARDFLVELIRFPSTQGNESDCQQFVAEAFGELNFEVALVPIPETVINDPEYTHGDAETTYTDRPNILVNVAGTGASSGRSLILNTHTDVVPAPAWNDAFEPHIDGDTVTGRGSADAKGCVATLYLVHAILARLKARLGATC